MTDSSNSNSRVVRVLNFLAAHPTETFTLAEIAQRLGLSNGSAHRVMTTLTKARYLSRHPKHKTYSLGVALVAIGQAALEKHRGVEIARRELLRLAEELQAQCILTTIVDNEMLFLAREGVPQTDGGMYRVGERRPFIPPMGLAHMAWADRNTAQQYFEQAKSVLSEPMLAYLKEAIDIVRSQGYAMAAYGETLRTLSRTAPLPISTPFPIDSAEERARWSGVSDLLGQLSQNEILLLDPAAAGASGIAYIAAPVFAPDATVRFEMTVSGLPGNLSAEEIERYIKRLRAAAAVVTRDTYGRVPGSA